MRVARKIKKNISERPSLYLAIGVMFLFGVIGLGLVLFSSAATPVAHFESENGARSPRAVKITDATASGGSAVKFVSAVKPDASTTGVPAGKTLAVPVTDVVKGISVASNGNVTINKSGLFENMLIKGRLTIKATDVTIRYSRIEANPTPWDLPDEPTTSAECSANGGTSPNAVTAYAYDNLVIEDSEITATRKSTYIGNGIHGSRYTLRRVDLSGTVDGAGVFNTGATNVLIEDSYIHDLYRGQFSFGHGCDEPTHTDGIQVHYGSNTVIRNNTIKANTIDWNGAPANSNAAIMVNQNGSYYTTNLTIDSNWLDYGGCSVNVHDGGKTPTIQYFALTNNVFGKNQNLSSGGAKCAMIVTNATKVDGTNAYTGNKWEDGSSPAPTVVNGG